MTTMTLPARNRMYAALRDRDASYEGVFIAAVKTTAIFCRPTCPARKPKEENVEYFATCAEALAAGYRPCRRCRPLEPAGAAPDWLRPLLDDIEADAERRWKDQDLRDRGLDPSSVRRWFKSHHGMTFHAYHRSRRLGLALSRMRSGEDLTRTAYAHGYDSVSGFRDAFERLFGGPPGERRRAPAFTVHRILTPLGPMVAGAVDEGLCLLEFADRRMLETQLERLAKRLGGPAVPGEHEHLDSIERELTLYFERRLTTFETPIVMPGTEFQQAVWSELLRIPPSETSTYEAIARAIGRPGACRAVGRANGDNRLAIIVPCHRVVRSDGTLCGYGGGLWRKKALLDLERP